MYIKSLELKNYINYKDLSIEFEKGTNILYGNNAQGKTNILEAIYVASTTKSHRGSKDREIINFDKDEAHIKITVMKKDVPQTDSTATGKSDFFESIEQVIARLSYS